MTEQPQGRDHLDDLRTALKRVPDEPGVYRFMGSDGRVLYVGKAKSLRKRVGSYLRPRGVLHGRTREMLAQAVDIDWVVTASEGEALLLEDNFIKEERPPYNTRLRDDKSYPSIEITMNDEWPRVRFFRGRRAPGNLYFGPFSSARKVRETLELIGRIFPYRKCKGPKPGRPSGSPCLQYFIKRSLGPCEGCDHDEYMAAIQQVIDFLRGHLTEVERDIKREMTAAAAAQQFEKAALLRDRLSAVPHVHETQSARIDDREAFDVIGLSQADPGANVQLFRVRDGAVVDRRSFYLENAAGAEPSDVLEEFLLDLYWEGSGIPAEIVAPLEEAAGLAEVLSERRGTHVTIRAAKRGPKRRLLELARHNAEVTAQAEVDRLAQRTSSRIEALERLRDALALERLPLRIECYDISNLGERHAVGSMVVFEGGVPKKAHYRKFKVRDVAGQDDFAMMNEVLRRRFERRSRDTDDDFDQSFSTVPDLVVVDGGKGQLSAARAAVREVGVDVDLVGLAKQREEVFVPGRRDPLPLPPDDPASLLLQRIRDEAHRFAVTYHRQRRDADVRASSIFDELPHVGPVRRRRILEHFGSPERFLRAGRDEIERVPGLPPKVAREIYAHLHKAG